MPNQKGSLSVVRYFAFGITIATLVLVPKQVPNSHAHVGNLIRKWCYRTMFVHFKSSVKHINVVNRTFIGATATAGTHFEPQNITNIILGLLLLRWVLLVEYL